MAAGWSATPPVKPANQPAGRDRFRRWATVLSRPPLDALSKAPAAWTWPWIARRSVGVGIVLALALTIVWGLTGTGYYWPGWIWFAVALPAAAVWSVRRALQTKLHRALAVNAAACGVLTLTLVATWLLSGHRYFWPIWPILSLAVVLAGHALLVPWVSRGRERELTERVDVLTRTRKDALDVHVAEMRRVERDLHDGAQARLVALGMSLGMADELFDSDPVEARRLLADARTAAGDALGDLRALVRGILPPVLADRGLSGAVGALALASPIPVDWSVELPDGRLPAPLESAAYFAIAEAFANVVKHSEASFAWIRVGYSDSLLSMVVGDDGRGGADPGRGSGLRGIERRLQAFDGTVVVTSPAGGPTVLTMTVPCAR